MSAGRDGRFPGPQATAILADDGVPAGNDAAAAEDVDDESSSDEGAPEETWDRHSASFSLRPAQRAAARRLASRPPSPPPRAAARDAAARAQARRRPGPRGGESKKRKRSLEVVAEAEGLALHLFFNEVGLQGVSRGLRPWGRGSASAKNGSVVRYGRRAAVAYARQWGAGAQNEGTEVQGDKEEGRRRRRRRRGRRCRRRKTGRWIRPCSPSCAWDLAPTPPTDPSPRRRRRRRRLRRLRQLRRRRAGSLAASGRIQLTRARRDAHDGCDHPEANE